MIDRAEYLARGALALIGLTAALWLSYFAMQMVWLSLTDLVGWQFNEWAFIVPCMIVALGILAGMEFGKRRRRA